MSDEARFRVVIRDFRATDLSSRNRFKDKLRVVGEFDDKKFKSKKQLVGGGDVQWKFTWKHDYEIYSHKFLDEKSLKISIVRSKTEEFGNLSVDLYTLATGPAEHNLPLKDREGKVVGRLNFVAEMEQVACIAVVFKQIKLKNLKPHGNDCNPYLKYAYSRYWPAVEDGKKVATYTSTQFNNRNPEWYDLPEIRFEATLKELLQESVVLHVTHNGTVHNTTLGRCNLLFRTLVDNGKTFKDEDLISFKGPLKVENAEIEGLLNFKFLPKYAQMKPVNVIRKAIHTEKGIYDASPLLANLPTPKLPIIRTDEKPLDTQKALGQSPSMERKRLASTVGPKSQLVTDWKDLSKDGRISEKKEKSEKNSPTEKREKKVETAAPPAEAESAPITRSRSKSVSNENPKNLPNFVDDLISLDTPPSLRRQRSISHSFAMAPPMSLFDPFSVDSVSNEMAQLNTNAIPNMPQPAAPSVILVPANQMNNAYHAQYMAQQQQLYLQHLQQQQQLQQQLQQQQMAYATNNPFAQPENSVNNPFATPASNPFMQPNAV